MNISMGCDHGAYHLKEHLKAYLEGQGHQVVDCGCHSTESVDYPVFCKAAAEQVTSGACERAIVLCTTGIGASIAANKVKGIRCALCGDPYSAEIIRSMIRTLAYKVCRIIARHVETGASEATSRSRNEEYFNQFMGVLTRHYMQQRSVGFYAEQLNLTPKYLTTIIRKTSGRTAVQWIDDYVVLEAKNLLKYSTMSIQEISYYLNFPNQSFFGKYFKNHTGMTPTAYRLGK